MNLVECYPKRYHLGVDGAGWLPGVTVARVFLCLVPLLPTPALV